MSIPHLLVHDPADNVGVVVVEGLAAGTEMRCVVPHDHTEFRMPVSRAEANGHKGALRDLAPGDTVIKYGQDIGRMVAPAKRGEHVHVHNLKTKRW
ncbi:MAG: UxaA family hydrolase [Pseudomonadota bacterium]